MTSTHNAISRSERSPRSAQPPCARRSVRAVLVAYAAFATLSGCSSSSGQKGQPGDSGAPADGSQNANDSGTGAAPDGSSPGPGDSGAGGTDGGAGGGDSSAIVYAASCGDGGKTPATPSGSWVNATGNLAGLGSECGNMSFLSSKPDEDLLIAGIAQQGLWGSRNGGTSWSRLGTGAGSATIVNRTSDIVYDPAHPDTFWESGIYNSNGVYKTTDDGTTLAALGSVTHNDTVSVDFTDPQRQTLLAGGHEQTAMLYRSTNGGSSWTNIGSSLPAGMGFSSNALVIDAQTHLVGTYNYNNTGTGLGIFRTINGGQSWTEVYSTAVQGHPLVMQDGTIYWSVGNNGGLVKSTDKGQTWQTTVGSGALVTGAPIELPDGRIAAVGSQAVMVSADCGVTFHAASTALPFTPTGLAYSAYEKAFYVWHFDCTGMANPGDPVPSNAIMKYPFDYTTD